MKAIEKLEERLGKFVRESSILTEILNNVQNPKQLEKVVSRIEGILTTGEEIEYLAVQKKPIINISPDSLVLTNKRIIIFRPANMGLTLNFSDILWKDVKDCHIKEGFLGTDFYIKGINKERGAILNLPKDQARKLYRIAQEREEEMIEVRRQRAMEESRAGAANVVLSGGDNDPKEPVKEDPIQKLKQLKELLENNLISQEEFDKKKAGILENL